MTTPHPQILAWLAENAADCVPKNGDSPDYSLVWGCGEFRYADGPWDDKICPGWRDAEQADVRDRIELGGWKAIRKWCSEQKDMGSGMLVQEHWITGVLITHVTVGPGTIVGFRHLGSGTTDADAIWAALQGIGVKR